jgi:enoyl-[acyl-carrier protein] reductase II
MVLTPQVVDAVNIPVIAAGGIADGRGIVATFALGASGVQIGTRFICSDECNVHENYKNMVLKSKDRDAIVTGRTTGHPVRTLKNKLSKEILNMEKEGQPTEEIDKRGIGSLRIATIEGDINNGSFMAGQIASIIKDVKPCKDIIEEMVSQAKNIMPNIQL